MQHHCVAFKMFCQYRPKNVKTSGKILPLMCVCEYCENVRMPVAELTKKGVQNLSSSSSDILKKMWCPFLQFQFPDYSCATRSCNKCGVGLLLNDLLSEMPRTCLDGEVMFGSWQMGEISQRTKKEEADDRENVNTTYKIQLIDMMMTVCEAVHYVCEKLDKLSMQPLTKYTNQTSVQKSATWNGDPDNGLHPKLPECLPG